MSSNRIIPHLTRVLVLCVQISINDYYKHIKCGLISVFFLQKIVSRSRTILYNTINNNYNNSITSLQGVRVCVCARIEHPFLSKLRTRKRISLHEKSCSYQILIIFIRSEGTFLSSPFLHLIPR